MESRLPRTQPTRRKPCQERSKQLVAAVREACRQVLDEQGPDGLTTARIAERAGVSVGSIYQYFESKEQIVSDLFRSVLDDHLHEAVDWGEDLRSMRLREQLRVGLERAIEHYRHLLAIDESFFRSHHASFKMGQDFPVPADAEAEGALASAEIGAVAFTRGNLERNRDQLRPERIARLDHACFLIGRGIPAILRAALEEEPQLLEDETFIEEVLDMMVSYLIGSGGSRAQAPASTD